MNFLSSGKYLCFLHLFYASIVSADNIKIVEVLAPKQSLAISTSKISKSYVDERYTFSLNRTVADQLQTVIGVNLTGQGGQFQSYAIRGFSRARIRTEIDGIPIITDRQAGNSASFIAPNLFSIASVTKGPNAAIYGSQAMGGVVSLTTEMEEETSIKLGAQLTNNGVDLTLKHREENLSAAFAYQHANNSHATNGDEINSQFERVSGLLRYQHKHDNLTTTVSWLPSYGQHIGKSNAKFPNLEMSQYPQEVHSLTQIQINSDNGWLAKLFHHYQNWDSKTLRFNQYQSLTQYQSNTLGGQWLTKLNSLPFNSFVGIDWLSRKGVRINGEHQLLDEMLAQETNLSSQLIHNNIQGEEDNVAIFSKQNWQAGKAHIGLGLRYDWIKQATNKDSKTDNNLSASLSLHYPMRSGLDIDLEIANGFRYPSLSELFFAGITPRGFIQGNNNLKAESSLGTQISINWQEQEHLSLHGTFYHYELDNYIERYQLDDETLSYRNVDSAQIDGFEAELRWYMNDHIEHHLAYQQQKGIGNQQQPLADLHPRKMSWVMLSTYNNITLANSVSYHFTVDRAAVSEVKRESFLLWDLSVNYEYTDQQTVILALTNISNESYYGSLDKAASLQPERSMRISINWQF